MTGLGKLLQALPTNGWTTYASGIAMILIGVAGMVLHFVDPENQNAMDPSAAVTLVVGGLGLLGLGSKGEKTEKKLDELADKFGKKG